MKRFKPHVVFILISILYFLFSLFTYKDYGITADEELNYKNGKYVLKYLTQPTTQAATSTQLQNSSRSPLFDTHNRLYPALVSLFNSRGYYEWYHLLNMFFAFPIFAAFYYLIYGKYEKVSYAVLALFALFLTPRFLGHIPGNPKDVPFAVVYFISIFAIYRTKNFSALNILLLGLLFGIAQSIRTVGFSLYFVFIVGGLMAKKQLKDILLSTVIVFLVGSFIMASTWAFVGANYFRDTVALFLNASDFAPWNKTMLFMGKFLTKNERPSIYLPVWFLITTPLYALFGTIVSFLFIRRNKLVAILWAALAINAVLYYLLNPVIYNGLRHFLYILPIVVLLAILGLVDMYSSDKVSRVLKIVVTFLIALNIATISFSLLKLHPYEYIYFNEFTNGLTNAAGKYEMDYWGTSYKEGADWLKTQPYSKVYACNLSFAMQYYSGGKYEMVSSQQKADYMICDYDSELKEGYTGTPVFRVVRNNIPINTIRRVNGGL